MELWGIDNPHCDFGLQFEEKGQLDCNDTTSICRVIKGKGHDQVAFKLDDRSESCDWPVFGYGKLTLPSDPPLSSSATQFIPF
ncbi:unnamed protein product [Sphenostylis stenocarpa]|uniref:Uncharacterized protein n=1 Tax=Sphenostylis stenocarpa TaxID=92480 RepID=A0AA86SK65_9FABA|nr:unnamed protein product [Sphenostylis stenocarpa]